MSKVDWITWKTDPKEIINPDKIKEELEEDYQQYDSYINTMVYEQLMNEIEKGGLTKDAFNISGISPAHEIATEIVNTIDEIRQTMKVLKNDVEDATANQKEIEKQQLIDSIQDKMNKEQELLKQKEFEPDNKDLNDSIYIIQYRIKKLQERLEVAQSL